MFKYVVFSGRNAGKYGLEKSPYLDTFYPVRGDFNNGSLN